MENIKVMFSSEKSDWSTPQDFYDELDREFHFDIDLCADETNHKHENYFSEENNAVKQN